MKLKDRLKLLWLMFVADLHGAISMRGAIMIGIAFFLLAIVFPLGMGQIVLSNTTGWNASVITIWTVLVPILAAIGVAIRFIPGSKK